MVDFTVIPQRTALINVDPQNCFISSPNDLAVLERINELAAVCREAGVLVIHTRHILAPDGSDAGVLADIFPELDIVHRGSEGAEYHDHLVVDPRDVHLEKPRFGAFYATNLELLLRTRGIDTVIISGYVTNVCCETTAREAAVRDFRVFFLSDGTSTGDIGDVTRNELQRATLATLGILFAQVLTVEEMTQKILRASHTLPAAVAGELSDSHV